MTVRFVVFFRLCGNVFDFGFIGPGFMIVAGKASLFGGVLGVVVSTDSGGSGFGFVWTGRFG